MLIWFDQEDQIIGDQHYHMYIIYTLILKISDHPPYGPGPKKCTQSVSEMYQRGRWNILMR